MIPSPKRRRTILITGTSTGIGYAAAREMAGRGWQVFATVRNASDAARLGLLPGVQPLFLDYTNAASIAACAERVLNESQGRIEALFNNGGYGQHGALEDLPTEALRLQFETLVFGWHELTRRLIPAMRAAREGRIVQCSSVLGFSALGYRGAYIAAKHAIEGLTDTLRIELADSGIKVISIQPGPIRTNFLTAVVTHLQTFIDMGGSVHRKAYEARLDSLARGGASRFKLPPEAVAAALVHACESPRPRPVYRVTLQSKLMAMLTRLLPKRTLHRLAVRLTKNE